MTRTGLIGRTLTGTIRGVRAMDHAAGRLLGRRRVLVDARSPLNFAVMAPLVAALRRDDRVDVDLTSDGRDDIACVFEKAGLAHRVVDRQRARWTRYDLYLNADPWNPAPLARAARRINFFHGVAGKYDLDQPKPEARPFDGYDRIAFINADRMNRYLAAGIVTASQAALVGYPKLDALVCGAYDATAVRASLRLDVNRPTVIYAPTWSPASSLHVAGEAIIDALLARDFNVIAKLHDNCFLPGDKYAAGIDWRARLSRFTSSGRFALAEAADASPYLAASDAMVTDHSSIGFEYLVLDRPLAVKQPRRRRRKSSRALPDRERCDERLVIGCLDADERRRVDDPPNQLSSDRSAAIGSRLSPCRSTDA